MRYYRQRPQEVLDGLKFIRVVRNDQQYRQAAQSVEGGQVIGFRFRRLSHEPGSLDRTFGDSSNDVANYRERFNNLR